MRGMQAGSGKRRWIILGNDGRHVSVGRAADPSEAELDAARLDLEAQDTGGCLAVMEDDIVRATEQGGASDGPPPHRAAR